MSLYFEFTDVEGSVKEIESRTVSVFEEGEKVFESLESSSIYRFDERKNLIESFYEIPDKYTTKTLKKYDAENRLIEIASFTNDSLNYKSKLVYNSGNKIIERKVYNEKDELQNTIPPIYTKDGFCVEESFYEHFIIEGKRVRGSISFMITPETSISFSNKNVYKSVSIYDKENKLVEVSFYNRRNRIKGKAFVIYNADGKPTEITTFGSDTSFITGKLNRWQELLLPVMEKIMEILLSLQTFYKLIFREDFDKARKCLIYGVPLEEEFITYDDQKRIIEKRFLTTLFESHGKKVFKYDEKGNKGEEILFSSGGTIFQQENHKYDYDSENNWIQRKTFYKFPVNHLKMSMDRTILTYRTIKYY